MIRTKIATVVALAPVGCSPAPVGDDISGVYTGRLENGRDYRLEMSDTLDYRFCNPDDAQCADPEFAGLFTSEAR